MSDNTRAYLDSALSNLQKASMIQKSAEAENLIKVMINIIVNQDDRISELERSRNNLKKAMERLENDR